MNDVTDETLDIGKLVNSVIPVKVTASVPVSAWAIRNWCHVMGITDPLFTQPQVAASRGYDVAVAPPAMLQLWTVLELQHHEHGVNRALRRGFTEAGYSAIVATNYDLKSFRLARVGDLVTTHVSLESISSRKDTPLGGGYFATEFHEWFESILTGSTPGPAAMAITMATPCNAASPEASSPRCGLGTPSGVIKRPSCSEIRYIGSRAHVAAGHRWCVELDLEKFFDRVNHDVLMAHMACQIEDKRVLTLIRRYLEAGTMSGGIARRRQEGTPQGGPLSPLLSNILLNELDRELERRGHRFVRYADDANIYVRSRRAGARVMAGVERFLNQRLRLMLNREKSRVAGSWMCDYLGYGMSWHQQPRLRVATMSLGRLRDRLRGLLRGARGHKMANVIERINPVLRGWAGYFKLTQGKRALQILDGWVRHKLRCVVWRQWKQPSTRARNLMRLGIDEGRACISAPMGEAHGGTRERHT